MYFQYRIVSVISEYCKGTVNIVLLVLHCKLSRFSCVNGLYPGGGGGGGVLP